ncbi:conserved hypothetical protein [Candidatus Zixiibacteriota bacterium]|nr:conserved hypothetical protein [candidate division Zixibacteria bacterium]
MKKGLSHRERIAAIMKGERPDRPAVSLWRHFYHREATAEGLAEAMLAYQKKYDWDFMKINPRASYHVEDWGNNLEWSHDEFKKHIKLNFAVKRLEDWESIGILNPTAGVLGEHLKAIRLIRKGAGIDLPLFMTIFSPISIAGDLVPDGGMLSKHLGAAPDRVLEAIQNITITFERYAAEIRNAGADGIFFATTEWASADAMTYESYEELARPFDLRILKAAGDGLNILHVCGSNNFLKELSDYPAPLVNWDGCNPTNANLDRGLEMLTGKTVIGGIDHTGWLLRATPNEIRNEIARLKERYEGRKVIFGPGCTYEAAVPEKNIAALREEFGC